MQRTSLSVLPLLSLLSLGACRQPLSIDADTTLSGVHEVSSFTVAPGVTLTVTADLEIDASDVIVIEGDVTAADESGASITLRSRDDVEVFGSITAGSGRHADPATGDGNVTATDVPGDGGDVTLISQNGRVGVRGDLTAGDGGDGGDATATGQQAQRAESGRGAPGGRILITAATDVDVGLGNALTAGAGGDGGTSSAEVPSMMGEDELEVLPAAFDASAVSGAGGAGGDVVITLTGGGGRITLQADIEAGDGGDTSSASATGLSAEAVTQKAGRGGDVTIGAPTLAQVLDHVTPEPGDGGGNTGAANQATASGVTSAVARVGAGGDPGRLTGSHASAEGDGGSTANAAAFAQGANDFSPGRLALGSPTPAPEHEARVP